MTDATTSLVAAPSARAEWTAFRRFLARPRLPERAAPFSGSSLAAILRMFGLDILLMAALALIAGAVMATGFELPDTALAGMEITPWLAFAVVAGAPFLEEIVFRGWLSGRPGHVLAIAIIAVGIVILTQTSLTRSDGPVNLKAIGTSLAMFAGAGFALFALRGRGAMDWFQRAFPLFFWLSTLAFACVHLFNFDEGALWVLLPLVLPQFVLGSILGYLRVNYGLWSSMVLHALHNGTALGLVWIGTNYAAGAGP